MQPSPIRQRVLQVLTGVPSRIRWAAGGGAAPLKAFRVEASSDGKTFVPVAGCDAMPAAARECLWSAPGPVSNNPAADLTGLIRISSLNTSLQDTSGAPFEIAPVSLAVTAPTAGTIWRHNTQATVKWTPTIA